MFVITTMLGLLLVTASAGDDKAASKDDEPRWVTHRIVAGETYEDLENRYGVTKKEIVKWNKKRLGEKKWLYAGRKLRIKARRFPPPREKITYIVQKGDSWNKIAERFNVRSVDLRTWNKKVPRRFKAGQPLTVWTNEEEEVEPLEAVGEGEVPTFKVRGGAYAQGKPNRGRLVNGVQLPKSEYYTIRKPERAYGTSHAVLLMQQAIATWRLKSGYEGELLIADMSKKGGGRLRPHSSHQTGRDVDIRLPKLAGVPKGKAPTAAEIDWRATWVLVKAFLETEQIEYIFLDYKRQKRLVAAAKALGEDEAYLRRNIQFPGGNKKSRALVRHAKGHTIHMHVRFKCAPDAPACSTY